MSTRLKRVALQAVMVLAAVNIWTGSPLLALWVGSRVVDSQTLTMGAVAAVVGTMLAVSLALVWVLGATAAAYARLTGSTPTVRRHVPWLRSMRDERVAWDRRRAEITPLERILVASVVVVVLGFEAWFFITDPSPLPPGPSKD